MQYVIQICTNVIVNIYMAESYLQDDRSKCTKVKDK